MKQIIEIKGNTLGTGKPCICVPIMEKDKESIISEVTRLVDMGARMIEWRVDAFEDVYSPDAVRQVLEELKFIVNDTILLFTFRSKKQGGLLELDHEMVRYLHQVAAESKVADIVDVEYFDVDGIDNEIHMLQKMGVYVIASHHDFDKTPSSDEIAMLLEQMAASKTDIVKIALMPQSTEDVLCLLEQTNSFHKKYPNIPLISMSMGKLGVISRISGEIFGSCVTFGAGKNASAPGQIPMKELQQILDAISG